MSILYSFGLNITIHTPIHSFCLPISNNAQCTLNLTLNECNIRPCNEIEVKSYAIHGLGRNSFERRGGSDGSVWPQYRVWRGGADEIDTRGGGGVATHLNPTPPEPPPRCARSRAALQRPLTQFLLTFPISQIGRTDYFLSLAPCGSETVQTPGALSLYN